MNGSRKSPIMAFVIIIAVAAITTLSIWVFVEQIRDDTLNVQRKWVLYEQQTTARTVILDELREAIGYGGFIHNFKNYVLRRTDQYSERVERDIVRIEENIARLRILDLTVQELTAVKVIEKTFDDYTFKFKTTKQEVAKATPSAIIDLLVKVDDASALQALRTLTRLAVERGELNRQSTSEAIGHTLSTIKLGYFLVLLVITSSIIFIFVLTQLRKAKSAAESSTKAKTDFLANMSHELRTPLNAVIGFSDAMLSGTFGSISNEKHSEYIEHIRDSGSHLLHLIDEILDLSKFEAGKLKLIEGEVILQDIIESSITTLIPRAESAGVRIDNNTPDTDIVLWADDVRIKQILLNLLSNAVKFTKPGSHVVINVRLCADHGCDISVADEGIGMDDDDIRIALDPFGQIDSTHTRHREGTGLGLPLTKGLVELHGGTLDITSEHNVGTTVTVRLPKERTIRNVG